MPVYINVSYWRLESEKKVKVTRYHCVVKEYANDDYYLMFDTHSYHCCKDRHFECKLNTSRQLGIQMDLRIQI